MDKTTKWITAVFGALTAVVGAITAIQAFAGDDGPAPVQVVVLATPEQYDEFITNHPSNG